MLLSQNTMDKHVAKKYPEHVGYVLLEVTFIYFKVEISCFLAIGRPVVIAV